MSMPVARTKKHSLPDPTTRLLRFIVERHEVYRRRLRGEPKPWTDDPILRQYRFCNVYRELDTVTRWIAEHWRTPNQHDPDLGFAMAVARWINWPDTLAEIGYPIPWNPDRVLAVLHDRAARGEKVWTSAYKVCCNAPAPDKASAIVRNVLDPLWRKRRALRPRVGQTLASYARQLIAQPYFGGFMAGQVIADLKYAGPLRSASDWWTWTVSGPGSRRGLNRVLGRDKDASWCESGWLCQLQKLHREITPMIHAAKLRRLHAQDLQSCCCEFDKIERVRLGEGKPRQKYPGLQ